MAHVARRRSPTTTSWPTATTRWWCGPRRRPAPKVWVAPASAGGIDATGCPNCGSRIRWDARPTAAGRRRAWACSSCALARPKPDLWLEGRDLVLADGHRLPDPPPAPGPVQPANAAMAAGRRGRRRPGPGLGVRPWPGWAPSPAATSGHGRRRRVRLLLAKNPAGWNETLDLIRPAPPRGRRHQRPGGRRLRPVVAVGRPLRALRGRLVVATGERGRDLAVRLRYAGVAHVFVADYLEARQGRRRPRRSTWWPTTPRSRTPSGAGPCTS